MSEALGREELRNNGSRRAEGNSKMLSAGLKNGGRKGPLAKECKQPLRAIYYCSNRTGTKGFAYIHTYQFSSPVYHDDKKNYKTKVRIRLSQPFLSNRENAHCTCCHVTTAGRTSHPYERTPVLWARDNFCSHLFAPFA